MSGRGAKLNSSAYDVSEANLAVTPPGWRSDLRIEVIMKFHGVDGYRRGNHRSIEICIVPLEVNSCIRSIHDCVGPGSAGNRDCASASIIELEIVRDAAGIHNSAVALNINRRWTALRKVQNHCPGRVDRNLRTAAAYRNTVEVVDPRGQYQSGTCGHADVSVGAGNEGGGFLHLNANITPAARPVAREAVFGVELQGQQKSTCFY